MATFFGAQYLLQEGPTRFVVSIQRLLLHLGFDDVRNVDGAGDQGADLLAIRGGRLWVIQCKWSTAGDVSQDGVNELEGAMSVYRADCGVLVTNARLEKAARKRIATLRGVGVDISSWTGADLRELEAATGVEMPSARNLRDYQVLAVKGIQEVLRDRGRALLVMATGLGKTVVSAAVCRSHLEAHPEDDVLVVAHMKDLVRQLEKGFWPALSKSVKTQVLTGDVEPPRLRGVTFATTQSALRISKEGWRPGLIIVDETHHLGELGRLNELLELNEGVPQLGATATPWRGDGFDLTSHFGQPAFTMGIGDGMRGGYLARVDYQLFVDTIDWEVVEQASRFGYSVKDLNAKLFLPERDEVVIQRLWEAWRSQADPRAILFCKTIEHAERIAEALRRFSPHWRNATCLHSGRTRREREVVLSNFRLGRVPIVTSVDILNEGVDVPDVNIVCFLRVTHSRRIFVQQLGRGLRIREGKDRVLVLDFVSDIRRIAALMDLKRDMEAGGRPETLRVGDRGRIGFSDPKVGALMEAWIEDAASLETSLDEARLEFPSWPGT